jgi:hypothetical protein
MANDRMFAVRTARRYGIPVGLFKTLVRWESNWQKGVVSPFGAIGYTQLMPDTARGLGVDPWNPQQNIEGGARYLRQQYDRFMGLAKKIGVDPWALALAAYNAGPGAVEKHGGIPPYAETQRYVKGILGAAGNLGAAAPVAGAPAPPPSPAATPAPPDLTGVALDNLSHIAQGTYTPAGSLSALTQSVAAQRMAAPPPTQTPTPTPPTENQTGNIRFAGGFLPAGAVYKPGRKDQGRDFSTSPGGAIIAPGGGVVVRVGSDPHGFGPAYPIIRFTSGPYKGQTLYIGHTLSALRPGQKFTAGQVLSHTGTSGVGNASTPGWAEIGYAPKGNPGVWGQSAPF